MKEKQVSIHVSDKAGSVSGIELRPNKARHLLLLSHGAGAGMTHHFMKKVANLFFDQGIATLRFNFPYTEQGKRAPNSKPILLATIEAAVKYASSEYTDLNLFFGGKSMGGRMGSIAAAQGKIPQIEGLVYIGFPLHAPGKDSKDRAAHLSDVKVPMIFLQGTRDRLANSELMQEVCSSLGPSAKLVNFEGADHSFNTRKKDQLTTDETIEQLVLTASEWMETVARPSASQG